MVCHCPFAVTCTQADRVMVPVTCRDRLSGTLTKSFTPSSCSPPLARPAVPAETRTTPFDRVPLFPYSDESTAAVPLASSNTQSPTMLLGTGFCTVTARPAEVVWLPATSSATAVMVCEPL